MSRLNLRLKATLFTANLVVLIVLIYSAFFLIEERNALRKEKELRAATILDNFVELNREALILNDRITLETTVRRVIANEDIVYALILSSTGDQYFASSLDPDDQVLTLVKNIKISRDGPTQYTFTMGAENLIDFSRPLVIKEKPLGIFHLGLSEKGINEVLRQARNKVLFISLPLLLLILALTLFLVTLAVKPIETITAHARTLGKGDLAARLNLKRGDEIGVLATTLDQMAGEIQTAQRELVGKERMKRELELARLMQTRLLPSILPEIPNLEIGSFFSPAYEVSGDFYDCFPLDEDRYGVVLADVAGKGLKGAWIASITRTILRIMLELEKQHTGSPKNILTRLNNLLKPDLERGIFVTLAFLLIDSSRNELLFASAGHPDLLHFGPEGVRQVSAWGPALGAVKETTFIKVTEEKTLSLNPGEGFLLYTDGVTEARNELRKEFGLERLKESLQKNHHRAAGEIPPLIFAEVRDFCGPKELDDDITMVLIKHR